MVGGRITPAQFAALAKLLRMRAPSSEAARLVLVEGMRPADAARAVNLSPQAVTNAVSRAKAGLELVRSAAGPRRQT